MKPYSLKSRIFANGLEFDNHRRCGVTFCFVNLYPLKCKIFFSSSGFKVVNHHTLKCVIFFLVLMDPKADTVHLYFYIERDGQYITY